MARSIIEEERVRVLRDEPARDGAYVLYWMQQSQRAEQNPALEHAVRWANQEGLPLVVGFGLMDGYPEANVRHYRFMLEGLAETAGAVERRGMAFVIRPGAPDDVALELSADAAVVVCDMGYLRHQREWRERVASAAPCRVEQVEGDVVVPVEAVTDKREYAARTIRPRIHRHLDRFLERLDTTAVDRDASGLRLDSLNLADIDGLLDRLDLDRSVPPVSHLWKGGTTPARVRIRRFRKERVKRYAEHRNQPHTDDVSGLSPYLHFGQVSPVVACMEVVGSRYGSPEDRDTFLEELVVRRELTANYCWFESEYDTYAALPGWARETLAQHADDEREHLYGEGELERAETHDPYWNAAMREMRYTGFMHNYMRMYWGKKILEWSPGPEEAYRTTLRLNNRYFLDGRDPASFTNVGWIFGLHDRAWTERDVFGKVRYMNANGLRRKTDPDAYVGKVDRLVEEAKAAGVRFPEDEGA